jgi:hypothetical protein
MWVVSWTTISKIEHLDFKISSLHSPQVRFLDFKINIVYNVLLLLDYLLINTVINSLQWLSSSNFHRIQMHLNRPILYIGLIVKYKTILILKSKNLTCGHIIAVYIYPIHTNWWRKFMVNSKLVVDKKSAPRLEGK